MNRTELCAKMKAMRSQDLNVSLNEVWRKVGFQPVQTKRMERGENNFNMNNFLIYLTAIGAQCTLTKDNKETLIGSYRDIIAWLVEIRGAKLTQGGLAELAGCTRATIVNIEAQKNVVRVDLFLSIMDALGCQVKISAYGDQAR